MATRLFISALLVAAASFTGVMALPNHKLRAASTRQSTDLGQPATSTNSEAQAQCPRVTAPAWLSDTGLFLPGTANKVDPANEPYAPQYPLWSDGAAKARWFWLPPGTWIDATDPNAWSFPTGTKFWKEFRFGRRVETRYIEKLAGNCFLYATYVWDASGRHAQLAPEQGIVGAARIRAGVSHDIPGQWDCRACHEGKRSRILGFNALQLSPDRDANAQPHESSLPRNVDLRQLAARGLIRGVRQPASTSWPRIAARNATSRAALGYLYGNCSHCHNREGPLATLGLDLDQPVGASDSATAIEQRMMGRRSHFSIPAVSDSQLIAPGEPSKSAIAFRMGSRDPAIQMPPLGTHLTDRVGHQLIERWISETPSIISHTKGAEP